MHTPQYLSEPASSWFGASETTSGLSSLLTSKVGVGCGRGVGVDLDCWCGDACASVETSREAVSAETMTKAVSTMRPNRMRYLGCGAWLSWFGMSFTGS